MASFKPRVTTATRDCQYCGKTFNARGVATHERSCQRQQELQKKNLAYAESLGQVHENSKSNPMSSRFFLNNLPTYIIAHIIPDIADISTMETGK